MISSGYKRKGDSMKRKSRYLWCLVVIGFLIVVASFSTSPLFSRSLSFVGLYVSDRFGHISAYASLSFLMCILFRNFVEVSVIALVISTVIFSTALGEMIELIRGFGVGYMPSIGDFLFNFIGTSMGASLFMAGVKVKGRMVKK
jgi:VanZ family protein